MKGDTSRGRQVVRDLATGRTFVVECIHDRGMRADGDWTNGGIDAVKHRGSISRDESIITPENVFTTIVESRNPYDAIDEMLRA